MKKNSKILLSIIFFIIILCISNYSNAKVTTNDPTVEAGGEVKITVNTSNPVSCFKIELVDAGDLTFKSVSKNSSFDNGSSNGSTINGATTNTPSTTLATYTFSAPEVTETKKITVKFSVSGMDNEEDVQNTSTVTVKPKQQGSTSQSSSNTNTAEPKFIETNKIMYATGDINLRSSWSTSSAATQIKKGTELKVTATSTNTVNGYTWYRVSYNGETKYVASTLLTNTKSTEVKEETEEKSNNANLKTLTIDNQELIPEFSSEVTKYTMEVENSITELSIKAEAEHEKATISIKGNTDLKNGENTVTISVNAEDGTVKIYEIEVTKLEKEALGLKTLTIKNTNIAREFKTNIYEYEIDIEDIEELEIEAIANDENATVEILGNENLQDGENIITIVVSKQGEAEEEEKVTYQIKVNKIVAASTEPASNNGIIEDSNLFVYIAVGVILLIVLIIIIVCIIKRKNKDEFDFREYNNDFEGFPGELPERQDYYNEERQDYFQEERKPNIEDEMNNINNQIISNNIEEQKAAQERKTKLDYFLDIEDGSKIGRDIGRGRGKHF